MTKHELIEIGAALGAMHINNREFRDIARLQGPHINNQMRGLCKSNEVEIENIRKIVMRELMEKDRNVAEPGEK